VTQAAAGRQVSPRARHNVPSAGLRRHGKRGARHTRTAWSEDQAVLNVTGYRPEAHTRPVQGTARAGRVQEAVPGNHDP
jgi:hypothetical protein